MKQIFTFIALLFISLSSYAQPLPAGINYQGVARNAQGVALANQTIKVKATLIKDYDAITTTAFYSEVRTLTTNQLGLFSFKIADGYGAVTTGNFYDGSWLTEPYTQFLKIELDVNNSGTWTDMGTQQIVSVPYALYAGKALTAEKLSAAPVAFRASSVQTQTIASNSTQRISFEGMAQGSTNLDLVADEFTAPETGMYHLDMSAYAIYSSAASGYLTLSFVVNNTYMEAAHENFDGVFGKGIRASTVAYLTAGQKVSLSLYNGGTGTATVGSTTTYFSGHLIR